MSDRGKLQRPEATALDASELGGAERELPSLEDPAIARERAGGELAYRASAGARGVAPMQRLMEERRAMGGQLATRVQRKADGGGAGSVDIPEGGGSQLADGVRAKMEPKLGADLSDVRVHTGGASAQAAAGLGARAFTVGSDVHFNRGEFAPGSKEGDRLLAHELTHVVQGKKSGVQRKADENSNAEVSHPDEPAEKEADAVAEGVTDQLHGGGDKKDAAGKAKGKDKDKKGGAHDLGAQAHDSDGGHAMGGGGGGGEHGAVAHEAAHVAQQGGGATHGGGGQAAPAEKPAEISAKFIGVGRKIFRNPQAGAAGAAGATQPAAAGSAPQPLTAQTPEQTLSSTEFKTFQKRYTDLMTSMQMPPDAAAAEKLWLDMVRTLQATDAAYKAAPTAPNSPRKDMSADAFKNIMKQFEPITAAMAPMMEKFTKGKKIWAFWSGNCACEIAKSNSEVSLEKSSLGHLFDQININGSWDIQMWASLSKAYATHAAKDAEQKTYRGFVGKGSSAEQSIFNQVEQPQFIGMLDQKTQASLKITWYACAADPKDPKLKTPDLTCNVAGMSGVMGAGSDRGAMVQMAETVNDKRAQVYAKTGKVVPPDQADAALADAEKAGPTSAAGAASSSTPAAGAGGKPPASAGNSSSGAASATSSKTPPNNPKKS